jgi:hypothetical protein
MTDHSADGAIKKSGPHDDAPLVPDNGDAAAHQDDAAAETSAQAASGSEAAVPAAPGASKQITLQRLTPHNSWEDVVFDERHEREQVFGPAAAAATDAPVRRLSVAAIVALAATVGAIGGSLATTGLGHYLNMNSGRTVTAAAATTEQSRAVDGALAKLTADLAAVRSMASSQAVQSVKLAERVERVEKAQAEPAAKLARLSEAVDKLRAAEATGSVTPPAQAAAAPPLPATVPNRMPLVDGWVLREVSGGMATVQGRQGIFDVMPGDPLPGVGRVDAIRRQDGRWVVVTSRGLIVAR